MSSADNALDVYLYGKLAATLERTGLSTYRLTHTPEGQVGAPLSLSLPQSDRPLVEFDTGGKIGRYLYNLLPDDLVVRDALATELGISKGMMPLLGAMGLDLAGAVQIVPAGTSRTRERRLEPISDEQIYQSLRNSQLLKRGASRPEDDRLRGRFSLAGFQTKFTLSKVNGVWFTAEGDEPSTHIVKPSIKHTDLPHQAFVEHVTMQTARLLGLKCAQTEFVEFGDEACVIVERYDRTWVPHSERVERIHQEDLCSALGVDTQDKYLIEASDLDPVLSRCTNELADRTALFEAFVFNALIGGSDAHAKNYSVLISPSGNTIALAPLYDLVSSFPYEMAGVSLGRTRASMAMAVGRAKNFNVGDSENWFALARSLRVPPAEAAETLDRLAASVSDALEQALEASSKHVSAYQWAANGPWARLVAEAAANASSATTTKAHVALPPLPRGGPQTKQCGLRVRSSGQRCGLTAGHRGYCRTTPFQKDR